MSFTNTVNKVILLGRLGKDPEVTYTQGGTAKATMSIATENVWKDAAGVAQKKTNWNRLVAWGKLAEICCTMLQKGSMIYVEGRLETRDYQDQAGTKKFITEVVLESMKLLTGGRPKDRQSGTHDETEITPPPSDVSDLPF